MVRNPKGLRSSQDPVLYLAIDLTEGVGVMDRLQEEIRSSYTADAISESYWRECKGIVR